MNTVAPEDTAARTALWRALHAELDPSPVLTDTIGLDLLAPAPGWRDRADMDPDFTRGMRAWVATRSRIVEDLVLSSGIEQYVLLGAGLDTFAQRHPDSTATVFEVDEPGPQQWKRIRLDTLGLLADRQRFVPVDFESDGDWLTRLHALGLDTLRPAVVSSLGVSMYLTPEATAVTLETVAGLAPGTVFAMTYQPPTESLSGVDRHAREVSMAGAEGNGTPFRSFYTAREATDLARAAGFSSAQTISTEDAATRYFSGRSDGLTPAHGEEMLIATV
ncbi:MULTISPECIES: class I SAM-dependent methyltransferase [Tsukamurella]|uniref:S-adenosyl-L-methionine-dependent methyltransferase n=2 Tax=Tsukamurella TaxID=2060 RepID=A0A5C5RPI8_9ACTN|nr:MULTISPECIES: class I SAM-dependent methyltransferase [Tsukamurella]NMD57133.1 class I SAM-dependent methyltransferase [Tsukamurella columbiensis]TWS24552.1 class I SAM-dependent methyltransferase [Tsukamurella conjunctivitidis]